MESVNNAIISYSLRNNLMFEEYYKAVQFLESLSNLPHNDYMRSQNGHEFYLNRTRNLLERLNINLEQFKVIHIAGTSGKGTTTAMVHNILFAAGKKVGSYYSPHPTTSIERILVNDKFISPEKFALYIDEMKPILEEMIVDDKYGRASYFEIFFAMALKYFAEQKCEYIVLETGCGGEFDATNVMPHPLITAITSVEYDHTKLLGKTLTKIATTKAGIIKKGSVFFTTEKRPHLVKIFKKICVDKKVKYNLIDPDNSPNARLAEAIGRYLNISDTYIKEGIVKTRPSERMEMMQKNPIVIVDVAHNPAKMRYSLAKLKDYNYNNLHIIFTLNENKDARKTIAEFKGLPIKNVFITRHLSNERTCAELKYLYNEFLDIHRDMYNKDKCANIEIKIDPWQALESAIKKAQSNDLILITGSFYLAGELRKKWISEEQILKLN